MTFTITTQFIFDWKNKPRANIDEAVNSLPSQQKQTWVFPVQKVTEVEDISLNYDQEGHSQKHKDDRVYWKDMTKS